MKFEVKGISKHTGEIINLRLRGETEAGVRELAESKYSLNDVILTPVGKPKVVLQPSTFEQVSKGINKNYGKTMGSRKRFFN